MGKLTLNWAKLKPEVKQVWQLSLPAILTQITTIAMQYIDSAMVGALGAAASAAIGLVVAMTWLYNGVLSAVSAGFSVQVAHHIGAGQDSDARNVIRHGLISALSISGLLAFSGLLLSHPLPILLGGDPAICPNATAYFFVYSLMIPFSQLNSLTSAFLQCSGDMVTPSILNAVMCVLDILFNSLLIPRFGVLGAGMGTALACAIISLIMAWRCCICNKQLHLRRTDKHHFDRNILRKAFQIGMPVAVQEIAMNGAMVVSTRIIAPLGAAAIAANSFAVTAESLCYMPGYGLGMAATTLVGRNIGAREFKTAKRFGNISTAMGAIFMGCTGAIMMFACPLVFRLLTPDVTVQAMSVHILRIELLAEPLFGVSIVAAGALRGTGDTFVPSLMNLGSIWIVRIGLALILVSRLGLTGMWIAMPIELCVRGLLMLYRQHTTKYYRSHL